MMKEGGAHKKKQSNAIISNRDGTLQSFPVKRKQKERGEREEMGHIAHRCNHAREKKKKGLREHAQRKTNRRRIGASQKNNQRHAPARIKRRNQGRACFAATTTRNAIISHALIITAAHPLALRCAAAHRACHLFTSTSCLTRLHLCLRCAGASLLCISLARSNISSLRASFGSMPCCARISKRNAPWRRRRGGRRERAAAPSNRRQRILKISALGGERWHYFFSTRIAALRDGAAKKHLPRCA